MSFNLDMIGEVETERPSTGASLGLNERAVFLITREVKRSVKIPVFAKLTPEGGNIGEIAKIAVDAGADGVCGTANRLGVPPIDIYHPQRSVYRLVEGNSLGCMSGPWIKPLALRDVLQMRNAVGPEPVVIGTGGVERFQDAVEMAMVGADLIGICTAVMLRGFGILSEMVKEVKRYLQERGKTSFLQIRDEALGHFKPVTELKLIPGYARVMEERCVGCGRCEMIAHCYAIEMRDGKAVVNRERCLGCSTCVDICPRNAVEMVMYGR
jgi:ferredoxin